MAKSTADLADILKQRGIKTIHYFHADHYEPWSSGIHQQSARGVERFAEMSRASPFGGRMSLFYCVFVPYRVDPTGKDPGRRAEGDGVVFRPRTVEEEAFARKVIPGLFEPGFHELHLHVHHEHWTRNDSHFQSDAAKWVNAYSNAEMDRDRLDLAFGLCKEVISRETGKPFDRWAFVHGNWALAASDTSICTVESELGIIMRHGGFGDFSFPAGRPHCDPKLEAPFTCRPIDGKRAYDDPASDPRAVTSGSGVMEPERFFIWNSPIKAQYSSLDYYSESNRELFKEPARIIEQWLTNSVAFGSDLFLKTHAHSMKWEYEIFKPDSLIPHLYPDVVTIFEDLVRICDLAGVEFRPVTVNEVMSTLETVDQGKTSEGPARKGPTARRPAKPRAAASPPAKVEKQPVLPVVNGFANVSHADFNAELAPLQREWLGGEGGTMARDDLYAAKIGRGATLEAYEIAVAEHVLQQFAPASADIVEIGTGYGALSLFLGRQGFTVHGYEGDKRRATAAAWHLERQSRSHSDLSVCFVPGFFPDVAAPEFADTGRDQICIATNITCTYSNTHREEILDAVADFDEFIFDLARFGRNRNSQQERDDLRQSLIDRGFEAVERLYFAEPYEYWRFVTPGTAEARRTGVARTRVRMQQAPAAAEAKAEPPVSKQSVVDGAVPGAPGLFPLSDDSGPLYSMFGDKQLDACPVCGGHATAELWRMPMSNLKQPITAFGGYYHQAPSLEVPATVYCFSYCRDCTSIYLNPVSVGQKDIYRSYDRHIRTMRDEAAWRGYEEVFDRFAGWIPETGSTIVDAACGIGQYLEVARKRMPDRWRRLIGLELSEKYVEHMRGRNIEAHVFDLDADSLDQVVKPGSADLVFFCEAFQYVERPLDVIRKLLGGLRTGGRLCFTTLRYGRDVQAGVRPSEPIYVGRKLIGLLPDVLGCRVVDVQSSPMRYYVTLEK